jgi:hypothetical protein
MKSFFLGAAGSCVAYLIIVLFVKSILPFQYLNSHASLIFAVYPMLVALIISGVIFFRSRAVSLSAGIVTGVILSILLLLLLIAGA